MGWATRVTMNEPPEGIPWLHDENIRPYIFMRRENLFDKPGAHTKCGWFKHEALYRDPLRMDQVDFADQILTLESAAFQKSAMPMPRWVFYDCSIMPGFVCGFARKTSTLPKSHKTAIGYNPKLDWTPISLFIIIPTVRPGEWVAHNLCTANSLVDKEDHLYALGFFTKAFGLWYASVEILCGFTQWQSPSIRLHSHYGSFEILTAYTPVHSHARTLTYRSKVNGDYWPTFFTKSNDQLTSRYQPVGFDVDPKSDESLKALQNRIERQEGPFYLNPYEIRTQPLDAPLHIYRLK
ncbi:unnamed protein product [Sphagnum balticum]